MIAAKAANRPDSDEAADHHGLHRHAGDRRRLRIEADRNDPTAEDGARQKEMDDDARTTVTMRGIGYPGDAAIADLEECGRAGCRCSIRSSYGRPCTRSPRR